MSATAPTSPSSPSVVSRQARVTANERLAAGSHRLELSLPAPAPAAGPGQFTMLSTADHDFPLLPRPFSLLGWRNVEDGGAVAEYLIMPVGRGSGRLCDLPVGGEANLVGPFGHCIDVDLPAGPVVCVAGGYGVAPFLFLSERLKAHDPARLADLTIVYGARSGDRLALSQRLEDTGARIELCTDDGSRGHHGRVDGVLASRLADSPAGLVLTCGPDPMMEAVARVAADAGVPARASLETVMGCGYAVCNGCAVAVACESEPDGHTYELACREGTIFDTERLQWELM